MPQNKPLYIAFEGGEGGGKSTQAELLLKAFKGRAVHTREPGGTVTGEMLRNILIHNLDTILSPMAETYLMAASRAQLLSEVIIPALKSGSHVISERTFVTSIAYQGAGRNIGIESVMNINLAIPDIRDNLPNLVIVFGNAHQEEHLKRTKHKKDKFETESLEYHSKITECYAKIADILGKDERTKSITVKRIEQYNNDKLKTPNEFHQDICKAIKEFCKEKGYLSPI